ncbi:MarR family winged helix-turn-helix transcriptional regulator [Mycobacterium sp. WMMD1722]|uniref:MarR family winged helix-turn-helix transcriptional regulator n=1 Tax=Mycobacterium sp. WMMD1722 TaxID=3404117 RepID=UPI003BF5F0E1
MAHTLDPEQLATYFALMETVSVLQYAVQQQLREDGDLSYVQFEILAHLADAQRPLTMTELADLIVYSRSGLTHQAGLLDNAGLITRSASSTDQRATVVAITSGGRSRLAAVLPGHVEVVHDLLFDGLSDRDVRTLGAILGRARDHLRARPPRSAASRRRAVVDQSDSA